jgi:tetratricopeptide (TPR) repeat protein
MSDRSMSKNGGVLSNWTTGGRWRKVLTIVFVVVMASVMLAFGAALLARLGPSDEILRHQADVAVQQRRWTDAEALLSRVHDPLPADWLRRAVVAISLQQPDVASRDLAHVSPDGPLAAQVALLTGRIELGRFRARAMEEALRRALRLDPKLSEARRSLVFLYGTQGRRRELLKQFAALAEQGPLTFDLVDHWCIAHQETIKEPNDLRSTLERFVENDPDDRMSRLGLARVYRQLGWFDRAKDCLAPLPVSDPDATASRAEIEFDRGDTEAVTRLLAGSAPDHPKLARLRGHLALNRQDGAEAVRCFRRSDAAEPNEGETLYGLAQALRIVGDRAAAEPYARRAEAQRILRDHLTNLAANREPRPILCCRLASDCEAAGYLPEARAWYRLAIAADPTNQQAQRGLFRLTSSGPDPQRVGHPDAEASRPDRN